jgi:uncharacterized protein
VKALRIAIKDIQEGLSTLDITCKAEEIGLEVEGLSFIDPITVKLKLFKQDDSVFVNAELSVTIESECDKCLSPVRMILTGAFENQYQPLPDLSRNLMDDIGIGYYSEDEIDLSDDIRESIFLELPTKILCSEDCKGLCPRCGQDLNQGKCDCRLEPEETQTSKFAEYLKSLDIKNKLGV